jgi:hypothetical protein
MKIVAYRIMENGRVINRSDGAIWAFLMKLWYEKIEDRWVTIEEYTVCEWGNHS